MMKIWNKYISFIRNNILISSSKNKDLEYWQDDMFTNTIIYIIPLSIISLIPSLIWSFEIKLYVLTSIDILALLVLLFIAFKKDINIKRRKLLFVGLIYTLSTFLVLNVGLNSNLFLLASCFLSTFIYNFKNQYTPALLNVYISFAYMTMTYLNLTPIPKIAFEPIELFAVVSNLIFLSFLICSLVPKLFHGLEESFKKSIEHNNKIEKQNKILKEITYIQSHVVRAPLSRIMAMTYLLKEHDVTDDEKTFFIENIIVSSNELDGLIQEIVTKSESIHFAETKPKQ